MDGLTYVPIVMERINSAISWWHLRMICLIAILLWGWIGNMKAQSLARVKAEDFNISGDTKKTGDNCYRLTEAYEWSSGSVWYKNPIDLQGPFEMELDILFGCDDAGGADGVVFVFAPYQLITGRAGEGMGFSGLRPSLGIEIDTWENEHLGDPMEDHLAILQNGSVHHFYNLAGPKTIPNLEDCRTHKLNIRWVSSTKTLSVSVDKKHTITYTGDLVKNIFRGNGQVYWGITAATGRYFNRHELCFESLKFTFPVATLRFDREYSRQLLQGESIALPNLKFQTGGATILESSYPDLYRLANMLRDYPTLTLNITGHTDSQGDEKSNQKLSLLRAQAVADFLRQQGIQSQRLWSDGQGEHYPVAPNSTAIGREQNRRVEVRLFKPRA